MVKEFLFLCGRIRALESKLLTHAQIDRMIGANSPEDAFRVLTELQYAEEFVEATRPQDYFQIIKKGLLETKKMIVTGTDNDQAFEFIWKQYDLSNIKRALKLKLVDRENALGKFSESDGFAFLGSLTAKEVEMAVFHGEVKPLPREYREALAESEAVYLENHSFRDVEFLLDNAHFKFLYRIASTPFLKELLTHQVDGTNLRSVARSVLVWEEKLPKAAVLPGGSIDPDTLTSAKNKDDLMKAFLGSEEFRKFAGILSEEKKLPEEILIDLERAIYAYNIEWISQQEESDIGTIIVPMTYLQKRVRNASRIKFVMAAKFYGIAPEKIYDTLKHF